MRGDAWRQGGFALVEAVLVMALLLSLSAGVALLGEWHDHGLRAAHASRLRVFLAAQGGASRSSSVPGRVIEQRASAEGYSMPGGAAVADLRRDWDMARDGLLVAYAQRHAVRRGMGTETGVLRRHTALLSGAGYAAGDRETQARIAGHRAAWRRAADRTRRAGRQVALALGRVDAGWRRAAPDFDWLSRWADLVPEERLGARLAGRGRGRPGGFGALSAGGGAR